MTNDLIRAYRFFREHAGYCTPPGAAACALAYAKAERDAQAEGFVFTWHDDPEPWDGDSPEPECVLGCVCETADGEHLESLWGIGMGHNAYRDPYRRVVEAELASEALENMVAQETRNLPSL